MGFDKLLNNENMHDVTFLVGESRTKMYGHKLILSTHNEFFNTMVSSSFSDSQKGQFIIPDIEADIFMEILRFMYCGTVNLTADNFLPIYKTADRYLMADLKKFCMNFLNEDIVTNVLIENVGTAKFLDLENACLELICNNPLRFFNDEKLNNFSRESLELICLKLKANRIQYCSNNDILSAINKWAKHKEFTVGQWEKLKTLKLSINKNERNSKVFFDISGLSMNESNIIRNLDCKIDLKVMKPCTLYGLGPFAGNKQIIIEVYIKDPVTNDEKINKRFDYAIQSKNDDPVQDLFIEKIRLSSGQKISFSSKCSPDERYFRFTRLFANDYFMIENGQHRVLFQYLLIES